MRLFLKTEKSKDVMPGPIRILRPALPLRLKHCKEVASPPMQFAFQNARSGAVGMAKQSVLMYLSGLPDLSESCIQGAKPVRERPVVGALRPGGVITGAPKWA